MKSPDFDNYHICMKKVCRFICGLLSATFAFSVLSYGSATNQLFLDLVPQTRDSMSDSVGVAKPGVNPATGTWKYKTRIVQPDSTYTSASSMTIKDNGNSWTATTTFESSDGAVTDDSTLEKGTLFLREESFKHFAKPGRPWSVTIQLKFSDSKVTGSSNRVNGHDKVVEVDLSGPLISKAMIGFLPLANGYSTTVRTWDVQVLKERHLQVKVIGMEKVTVAAGRFDAYRLELTPAEGGSDKETIWIARDSHMTVKASQVEVLGGGTSITNSELVP